MASLIAKVDRDGNVQWSSRYIGFNNLAYRMVHAESRKNAYAEIDDIEVRRAASGGWDLAICDEATSHYPTKREAQRAAEDLLDNSRDSYGYPLPTSVTR